MVEKHKNSKVMITKDGPYIVSGNLPLAKEIIITDDNGYPIKYGKGEKYHVKETCALCRCGKSKNKPYCDGIHAKISFDGTEVASLKKYLEAAEKIEGPGLILTDREELCFGAGFCHRKEGSVWELTEKSDDPNLKKIAIEQACNCPSGRLVAWDKKTEKPIEYKHEQSINLIEEPNKGVSGPIWVKGNVQIISSDGHEYEVRNRVALCRCGKSSNKPFCDGTHVSIGFNDGDETLKE